MFHSDIFALSFSVLGICFRTAFHFPPKPHLPVSSGFLLLFISLSRSLALFVFLFSPLCLFNHLSMSLPFSLYPTILCFLRSVWPLRASFNVCRHLPTSFLCFLEASIRPPLFLNYINYARDCSAH